MDEILQTIYIFYIFTHTHIYILFGFFKGVIFFIWVYLDIIYVYVCKYKIYKLFAKLHPCLTNQYHNVIIEVSYKPFYFLIKYWE